jgi:hypothetical protein
MRAVEGEQTSAAAIAYFKMALNGLIERRIRLVWSRPGTVPVVLDLSIAQMLKLLVHFAHDSIELKRNSVRLPFFERNTMVMRNLQADFSCLRIPDSRRSGLCTSGPKGQ